MNQQLGPLLLQAGVIDAKQLEACVEQSRRRKVSLWTILIEEQRVSEDSLADTFSTWLKLPRLRLASASISPETLKVLGEDVVRKHLCMPMAVEGRKLVLAMANPADFAAIQDVEFASGLSVRPVVASRSEVLDAIETHYSAGERAEDFLANVADASDMSVELQEVRDEVQEVDSDARAAEAAPVVKMCNLVIRDAIRAGASDIHIEAGLNDVQVRLRVDGVLREYMQIPKWLQNAVVSRLKILAKLDISERRVPQDGRIKVVMQGKPVDVRVSTLPTHFGEKVVMRLLGSSEIPSFQQLGYNEEQSRILENALSQPQGLVLVTGPTGSGKSTALYSALKWRQSPELNIVTVEDPIEYQLKGINQVQVNPKAGLTFAAALRSILRQDPDVVLLGEIRDLETAEVAFHAAMTGHLVLSTLHTNGTIATITRLLDMGVDPVSITSSVTLITAQRLARRICARCKEPYTPSSGLLERLRVEQPGLTFYRGAGCSSCGKTGYSGRVGLYELLRITPSLKELIQRKASENELRKVAGLSGTRFLLEDAMEKVRQGVTTLEEILRVIQLQEEDVIRCPKCTAFINLDFSSCPYCMYALKNLCKTCGQDLRLDWKLCPYCNTRVSPGDGEGGLSLPAGEPATGGAAAAAPALNPSPTAELEPAGPRAAVAPKKPYILVVDDDESIKKVVAKTLTQLPMEVEIQTAADGMEAVQKVQERRPDLVVLDVMMPRMDGFTVCQKLREDVRTAFVPVLMLTANADESSRTKGYLIGTDDYMNKPFSVPDLNARVLRLLRRTYGL